MDKTTVENVGQPGKTYRVDAAKYADMRAAVLTVTPTEAPGHHPRPDHSGGETPPVRGPLPRWRDRRLVGQMRATGSGGEGDIETRAESAGEGVAAPSQTPLEINVSSRSTESP